MNEKQMRRLVTLCREIDDLTADISKKRSMIQEQNKADTADNQQGAEKWQTKKSN